MIQKISKHDLFQKSLIMVLISSFYLFGLYSAPINNFPTKITQPDGVEIDVFMTGDEFFRRFYDENDFSIVLDEDTGFWCWAIEQNGDLISSGLPVHLYSPEESGLEPGANISSEKYMELRAPYDEDFRTNTTRVPSSGVIQSITIFIRFADQSEFPETFEYYDSFFNQSGVGVNSLYQYFYDVSYQQLEVISPFFPVPVNNAIISYQAPENRDYYDVTNNGALVNQLLKDAAIAVSSHIPTSLDISSDGEFVDNLNFIIRGAEGTQYTNSWNRLSPHAGILSNDPPILINGKKTHNYNLNIEEVTFTDGDSYGVGVLAHEFAHTLGLPDMYNNSNRQFWVGVWCLMGSNANPPPSISGYVKAKYTDWVHGAKGVGNIPIITTSGTYTLNSVANNQNNHGYRINSPYTTREWFFVEYRNNTEVLIDSALPHSGLLIYRTLPEASGNHVLSAGELYVYRSNIVNHHYADHKFYAHYPNPAIGKTAINKTTNPSPLLYDGSDGGLDISNIRYENGIIHFDVNLDFFQSEVHVNPDITAFPNYFNTIQEAIDNVADNGTVYIHHFGVYSGAGNTNITLSNLRSVSIIGVAVDGELPVIDCGGNMGFIDIYNAQFNTEPQGILNLISNLIIKNASIGIRLHSYSSPTIENVTFISDDPLLEASTGIDALQNIPDSYVEIIVNNCTFMNFANKGIAVNIIAPSIIVKNSVFDNIHANTVTPVYLRTYTSLHLENNVFQNIWGVQSGPSVFIGSTGYGNTFTKIINNKFINNQQHSPVIQNLRINSLSNLAMNNLIVSGNIFIQNSNIISNLTNVGIINSINTLNQSIRYINNTEIGFGNNLQTSLSLDVRNMPVTIKNSIFSGYVHSTNEENKTISNSWFYNGSTPIDLDEYIQGFSPNNISNIFTGNPYLDLDTYMPTWNSYRKSGLINAAHIDTNDNGIPWWKDFKDTKPDGTNLDIGAVQSNRNQKYIKHELEKGTYHWVAFPYLDMFYKGRNEDYPHLRLEYIFQNHHFNNLLSISPRYIDDIEWNYNDNSGRVYFDNSMWNGDMNHLIDIKHGYKIKTTDIHYNRPFITSGFYYGNEEPYNQITLQAKEAGTSYREIWLGYFGQNGYYVFDLFEDILDDIVEIKTQYWSVSRVPKTLNDWYISDGPLNHNII